MNRAQEFDQLRSIETDECVIWPYADDQHGYGRVRYGGRIRVTHRLALALATRIDPPHLHAAHGPCHKPACMNVRHLSWKTREENQADRVRDGTDNRGENSHSAKLTEAQAIEIIESTDSPATLAERFGVNRDQIYRIKNGTRWGYLQPGRREKGK